MGMGMIVGYLRGRRHNEAIEYEPLPPMDPVESTEVESLLPPRTSRVPGVRKAFIGVGWMVVFGTVLMMATFLLTYACEASGLAFVDPFEDSGNSADSATRWVKELSPLVSPVKVHSHNDYLRPHPLFSALSAGCLSVEADVWLSNDRKDLLVAHHWWSLSPSKTLRSLYIDPLVQILDSMNPPALQINPTGHGRVSGVFSNHPNATLMLFIDIKDDPASTWPVVLEQLKPLRDRNYLSRHEKMPSTSTNQSFWPGPVTIVGTGNIGKRRDVNIGPNLEQWRQYHDVFLDASLDLLQNPGFCQKNDTFCLDVQENEFYTASVSFWRAIGIVLAGFSASQLNSLRGQIETARVRNLKSRYWELPSWPISYRNYVWRVLVREGIDLLNADDVASAAAGYGYWESGSSRDVIWICGTASFLLSFSISMMWLWRKILGRQLENS